MPTNEPAKSARRHNADRDEATRKIALANPLVSVDLRSAPRFQAVSGAKKSKSAKPINPNSIVCGKAHDLIPQIADGSVRLVVTSPPYTQQRNGIYLGVSEQEYPQWFADLMDQLRSKLTDDGSVFVVIRPDLKDGQISDYVLKTRLAVRAVGWRECEELIWYKKDAPPLGSIDRPRRNWESILWFSKSGKPYVNLKACGRETARIGFEHGQKNGKKHKLIYHGESKYAKGIARIPDVLQTEMSDVIEAPLGNIARGVPHSAMFPAKIPETLIRTFSQEGDVVLDCFSGSGTTAIVARDLRRQYIGIDASPEYVTLAQSRLDGSFVPSRGDKFPLRPRGPEERAREKLAAKLRKHAA